MIHAALLIAAALAEPSAGPVYSGRTNQLKVAIPRLDESIQVDGRLDDAAWKSAARLTDFSQYSPNDGRPADQATEVLVFYSATAIHFGVRAEAAPGSEVAGTLLASLLARLGEISGRVFTEQMLDSIFKRFCVGK